MTVFHQVGNTWDLPYMLASSLKSPSRLTKDAGIEQNGSGSDMVAYAWNEHCRSKT